MSGKVAIGIESFREQIEKGYYYVDKTSFIKTIFDNFAKVTLITRPRRFGKTLNMSMLAEFSDITKRSEALFDGLAVSREKKLCEEWMNKRPVIFLSLKGVEVCGCV